MRHSDYVCFGAEICHLLTNQRLLELVRNIDEVNPKQREVLTASSFDIFEIYGAFKIHSSSLPQRYFTLY
ncbi:MAG: hypothetical protein WBE34_00705 [Candidatus Nitrosopolaris sp.]